MSTEASIRLTATDETQAAFRAVNASLSNLGNQAEQFGIRAISAFKGVGLATVGLGTAASLTAFLDNINKSIEALGDLKDTAERTGASVENLSALKGVASIGNRDFGEVEAGINRLNKALHGTDDESKGAGKALAALGLDIQKLRDMDPAEAMLELAKAQENFADGGGKSAAMMEILGKNGAALIPYLHDLAETQNLVGKVTAQQARDADDYAKNVKKLEASWGNLSRQMAAAVVGPAKDVTDWMLKAQKEGGALQAVLVGIGLTLGKVFDVEINPVKRAEQQSTEAFKRVIGIKAEIDKISGQIDDGKLTFLGENAARRRIENLRKELSSAEAELKSSTRRLKSLVKESVAADQPKDTSLDSQRFGKGESEKTDPHANDYSRLLASLNEKIAVQTADLNSVEKLTEAEKEYAKFQADLASGAIQLTAAQKSVAEAFFEVYRARNKQNELDKASAKAASLLDDYARGNAQTLVRIERESELALMTDRQRAVTEAAYKAEDDYAKLRERILRDIPDETAQKLALAKAEEVLAEQKEKVSAAAAKSYDDQHSFAFGWEKSFQAYENAAFDSARSAQEIFSKSTSGMEDALVQFATTGKISFNSLANSVIADIIRMQARMAVAGLGKYLNGLFGAGGQTGSEAAVGADINSAGLGGFAKGDVFVNSPSLSAYSGGVYSTPQLFQFARGAGVFGEAGPEAIMPLKRGRDGKLGVASEGGSGSVTVIVNNNTSAQATTQERSDGRGNKIIEVLVEQVKASIAGDISTGNGVVPNAMQSAYGVSRRAGAY